MKNQLFLTCSIAFALCACGKEDPPVPSSYLNFRMDSIEYMFEVTQFDVNSPEGGYCSIRSPGMFGTEILEETDFPYWLDIRKTSSGEICGVLAPKEFPMPIVDDFGICDFQIPSTDLNGNPLSMEEIFFYENGTFNYSKSDCETSDIYFTICQCNYSILICDVEGTFNMTFRNGLGESIILEDGNFLRIRVIQ